MFSAVNVRYQVQLIKQSKSYQQYAEPVSSPDKDIADPIHKDTVDPIYEDVETSVQQSKDVAATDVDIQDNPAYDTSVL